MNFGNFGWGWMIFGGFLMIVFWVAIIALTIWAVQRLFKTGQGGGGGGAGAGGEAGLTPLEIARRRYARGEITREQFEQLKQDLS